MAPISFFFFNRNKTNTFKFALQLLSWRIYVFSRALEKRPSLSRYFGHCIVASTYSNFENLKILEIASELEIQSSCQSGDLILRSWWNFISFSLRITYHKFIVQTSHILTISLYYIVSLRIVNYHKKCAILTIFGNNFI